MDEVFFFDSYAFFEVIKGNKNYESYLNSNIITTKLNLFELYFGLLKEFNEEKAIFSLNNYYNFAVDFDKSDIEEAANLKLKLNKRNVSMTDCIGYVVALKLGINFLTGDKEFENLSNVEFVK